jgi:hypothetical protein
MEVRKHYSEESHPGESGTPLNLTECIVDFGKRIQEVVLQ